MSEEPAKPAVPPAATPTVLRFVYAGLAILALVIAICFMHKGVAALDAVASPSFAGEHAPALFGLPIAVLLATVLVCGARALEREFRIEFLGLRADGAGALLLSWIGVFSVLALAIRGLW